MTIARHVLPPRCRVRRSLRYWSARGAMAIVIALVVGQHCARVERDRLRDDAIDQEIRELREYAGWRRWE